MWKLTKWNQTNYIIFVSRKEVTKKVYDSIMNSIKLSSRINTVFMNSKNSKSSDRHRPLFNLNDKINNLKKSNKYIALSNLNIYIHGTILKSHAKIIDLKYQLQHGMKTSSYLMDHILYQIFKNILSISYKNMEKRLIII